MGLPVVSVDFPEVRRYAGAISIAADADAFVAQIRAALAADHAGSASDRRAAVSGASWQGRAKDLVGLAEGELALAARRT